MGLLYLTIGIIVVLVIWRLVSPGDVRLNRLYLKRFIRDSKGNGPSKVKVTRIPVVVPAGQPEEKVYYHLDAAFTDGSRQLLTAQVFYPLEALQMEREKQKKPLITDDLNPNSLTTSGPNNQLANDMEKLKEDPLKEFVEEHKTVEQKSARLSAEIEQLRLLNKYSDLFPKLISHDTKRHITLLGAVGALRLDEALQQAKAQERVEILTSLVTDLARFHREGQILSDNLLPGISHSEELIRGQIGGAFEGLVLAGVDVSEVDIHEVIDAARVLIDVGAHERGPKLMDASPRAFFVQAGQAKPLDFGRVRRDISAIDVVELICDPSTGLVPEDEYQLYEAYSRTRFAAQEQEAGVKTLTRLSVYYRLVLTGYLVKHFIALKKAEPEQRALLQIKYWSPAVLPQAIAALKYFLARDPELARLQELLEPKLEQLQGWM